MLEAGKAMRPQVMAKWLGYDTAINQEFQIGRPVN